MVRQKSQSKYDKESEYRFRTLVENSPFSIELHDKNGLLVKTNKAWEKLWGLKSSDVVGKFNILKDKQAKEKGIDVYFRKAVKGEVVVLPDMKYDAVKAVGKGRYRWLRSTFYPINGRTEDVEYVVIVHNDITDSKIAEEILQKKETLLRGINNNLKTAMIYQVTVSKNGSRKLNYVSDSVKKFYGVSPEEAMNNINFIYKKIYKEDLEYLKKEEEKSIKEKKIFKCVARVLESPGKIRWSYFVSIPTIFKDGIVVWNGIETDITEQKKIEEKLEASQTLLNETANIAKVGGWEFDVKTLDLKWSEETYRIHEVDQTTFKPTIKKAIGFYSLKSKPIIEQAVNRAIKYGEPFDVELEVVTAKGNQIQVHALGKIINSKNGTKKVSGTFQDITEKNKVELALKKSEEKYRILAERSRDGIAIVGFDGKMKFVNPFLSNLLGYETNKIIGQNVLKFTHPNFHQLTIDIIEKFKKGMSDIRFEAALISKDGRRIDIEDTVGAVDFNNEKCGLVLVRDITERKKLDELLREKESRYRGLFETSRDAIMTLEPPSWNFTSGNPATLKMFGVKNEKQFLSYPPWKLSPKFQPDGRLSSEKAKEMIDLALARGSNLFDWVHKRINGEEFIAEVFLSKVTIGERNFLQGIVRDVTEQKNNQEKINNRTLDLERLNRAMIGREKKMIELKEEIKRLRDLKK